MVAFITGDCRKYTKVENTFFKKEDIIPPNKKKKNGVCHGARKSQLAMLNTLQLLDL